MTGERSWRNLREAGVLWRRHARYPVSLWAVEKDGESSYLHHVSDLSVGGAFLQKPFPIAVGTEMNLELALPNGATMKAKAKVVHAVVSHQRTGNGVLLEHASEDDRATLQSFLGDAWFN